MKPRHLLVAVALLLSHPLLRAQTFALNNDGARTGTATYAVDPNQHTLTAHIEYRINGLAISLDRKASFDSRWEELSETTSGRAGDQPVAYTVAPDASHAKLNFDVKAAGQAFHADFATQPRTAALANFDPSGIQVLLYLMAANPHPEGQFWAFAPMGRGALVGASLKPADDLKAAARDGFPVKHWILTLSGVQMDVYADKDLHLLAANIASQNVSYLREGFTLPANFTPPAK